ncbi:PIN domain-like protein [Mycena floridula]|nr:PIN domain-like protein [Mycena floridula]
MGVLGLTPFLQKSFPEVIKQLPDRLKAFAGKTIVLDGTLITQRLHFTQHPHPHRHVLGWYKLARELKEAGVNAICVFDGKERNIAKAHENRRRKEAQRLSCARGDLERDRLKRLQGLQGVLGQLQGLDSDHKSHIMDQFRRMAAGSAQEVVVPWPDTDSRDYVYTVPDETVPDIPQWPLVESDPLPIEELLESEDFAPVRGPLADSDEKRATYVVPDIDESLIEPVVEDLPDALTSLYSGYLESLPKLAALPSQPSTPDFQVQAAIMSKNQNQMTVEEGKLWKELFSEKPAESALSSLTQKSSLMSESYKRNSSPATSQTYSEAKEIIEAMGLPCLESEGTYEAEALASSLVLNGLADYVASEDTDVLIYEAPLIRNITNRHGPLTIMSGTDIRTSLQLSRESFIDFALLLGTDFSQRIKNVGPARALKFITTHGSIEQVIESEPKYPPRIPVAAYLNQVEVARTIFQTLPPIPNASLLVQKPWDDQKVYDTMYKYKLSRELPAEGEVIDYTGSWYEETDGEYVEDEEKPV